MNAVDAMLPLLTQAVTRLVVERPWEPTEDPAVWLLNVKGYDVFVERQTDEDGEPVAGPKAWRWTLDGGQDDDLGLQFSAPFARGGFKSTQELARIAARDALVEAVVRRTIADLGPRRST